MNAPILPPKAPAVDYRVAIPSYRRSALVCEKTLGLLESELPDLGDRVTVFVADDEEYATYRGALDRRGFQHVAVVVGRKGLKPQRKFIHSFYPRGTPLVMMDDDVESFLAPAGKRLVPVVGSFSRLVFHGFDVAAQAGARHWGVAAAANAMFLSPTTTVGLRYIIGAAFGTYAGSNAYSLPGNKSSGEDFEMTLTSFATYNAVVRLDGVTIKTRYFHPGGIEEELGGKEARQSDHDRQLKVIASAWPQLATPYTKSGGVTNLRLKRITHRKIAWTNQKGTTHAR